jgi:hypothetical protein
MKMKLISKSELTLCAVVMSAMVLAFQPLIV